MALPNHGRMIAQMKAATTTTTNNINDEINDKIMNIIDDNNNTSKNDKVTITRDDLSDISPAVQDYMRVTSNNDTRVRNNRNNRSINTTTIATAAATTTTIKETIPLEDMYNEKYSQRLAKLAEKYEFDNNSVSDMEFSSEEEEEGVDEEEGGGSNSIISNSTSNSTSNSQNDTSLLGNKRKKSLNKNDKIKNKKRRVEKQDDNNYTSDNRLSIQNECFLCSSGDKFHDGIRVPHINRLFEIVRKFYARVKNEQLAIFVHLYYKNNIYNEDEGTPMLKPHIILEHFEGLHSLSATNFLVESIRDQKQLKFIFKNKICCSDGSIDYKAYDAYNKSQDKLEKLYFLNIDKMNFNHNDTVEDLNEKGAFFNMMPMFTEKEEKIKRIKRKQLSIKSNLKINSFDL